MVYLLTYELLRTEIAEQAASGCLRVKFRGPLVFLILYGNCGDATGAALLVVYRWELSPDSHSTKSFGQTSKRLRYSRNIANSRFLATLINSMDI